MNKLLSNKIAKRWLCLAFALVLVVSMFPYTGTAFGDSATQDASAQTEQTQAAQDNADLGQSASQDQTVAAQAATEPGQSTPEEAEITAVESGSEEDVLKDTPPAPGSDPKEPGAPVQDQVDSVADLQVAAGSAKAKVVGRAAANECTFVNGEVTINKGTKEDPVRYNFTADKFEGRSTYTITVNGYLKGYIEVPAGKTVNIKGHGTIDASGTNHPAIKVTGSVLTLNKSDQGNFGDGENIKITGGTGTTNSKTGLGSITAGGGIQMIRASWNDGTALHMYGGEVFKNTAGAGGGIYINGSNKFFMKGGSVHDNTAVENEGGGIYSAGTSTINKGKIYNNVTKTTDDWGGGGLFIQSGSKTTLANVSIHNNTAYGLGGGVAGCPHANIGFGTFTEGGAMYANTAKKNGGPQLDDSGKVIEGTTIGGRPQNNALLSLTNGGIVSGDLYAYGKDKNDYSKENFTAAKAQDFYCTLGSSVYGQSLNGNGSTDAWNGYYAGPDGGGEVTIQKTKWYSESNYSLGLTALGTSSTASPVQIYGNTSYTHGGGIGCNGTLEIGTITKIEETYNDWTVAFTKQMLDIDGKDILKDYPELAGKFTFGLYTSQNGTSPIATATNAADGSVTFKVNDAKYAGTDGGATYTFWAKEITSGDEYAWDGKSHKVDVTLKKRTTTANVGGVSVTTHKTYVNNVAYGNENAGEGKVFTNKVKPTEEQRAVYNGWTISLEKKLMNAAGNDVIDQKDQSFTFDLYDSNAEGAQPIATAKNSNGTVTFTISKEQARNYPGSESGTPYTFYVKEQNGSDELIDYDASVKEVTVVVKTTSANTVEGTSLKPIKVTTTTHKAESVTFANNDNVFTNNVKVTEEHRDAYEGWQVELNKAYVNGHGDNVVEEGQFEFGLYDSNDEGAQPIATATNDADGKVTLAVSAAQAKNYPGSPEGMQYTFYAKELSGTSEDADRLIDYDDAVHEVKVTIKSVDTTTWKNGADGEESDAVAEGLNPVKVTTTTHSLAGFEFSAEEGKGQDFTNNRILEGTFALKALKYYYGNTDSAEGAFQFAMQRIDMGNGVDVDNVDFSKLLTQRDVKVASNGSFDAEGKAVVEFEPITYTEPGDYWYAITEQNGNDPRVYVAKVNVSLTPKDQNGDGMGYDAKLVELYYAESTADDHLIKLEVDEEGNLPEMEFHNFGDGQVMSVYGYSVNAASNAPIDQHCLVDPKIYKNLEGRSMNAGEFNFQLVELTPEADGSVDWSKTSGEVISETANDQYGMVDFDKAANVSTDPDNPCCLLFTAPGTYYYRVVEANAKLDPSVIYSDQIITFTVVVEADGQGQLKATDMYYGHVEDGVNVRYDESADVNWHPTMINQARGMDLMVRKTSKMTPGEGLEGATYGLYAVNDGAQNDIYLGNAASGTDGWITFKNVSLSSGTLYYFKEEAAPAGHTVSEFRSAYFYLVPDEAASNGYVMRYADTKDQAKTAQANAEAVVTPQAEGDQTQAPEPTLSDDGNMLFVFEKDSKGVEDEATDVEFNKLDTRTHQWVEGAKLAIIEKDSGKVINSWTSGKAPERLQGKLNVDTVYILREEAAPEKYDKAKDVEFTLDAYGKATILSGSENGNAELSGNALTLYNTMFDEEVVNTEERERIVEVPGTSTTTNQTEETTTDTDTDTGTNTAAPKTGDYLPIIGVVVVAAIALGVVLFTWRRNRKDGTK